MYQCLFFVLCILFVGPVCFGQVVPIRYNQVTSVSVGVSTDENARRATRLELLAVQDEANAPDMTVYICGDKPLPGLNGLDPFGRSSQIWQNIVFDREGLPRLERVADIPRWIARGDLHRISDIPHLSVSAHIPSYFRNCRKEAHEFLKDFNRDFYATFGRGLLLSSMVRDTAKQRAMTTLVKKGRGRHARWVQRNINASPVEGERASSHLRGAAFDISKKGMTAEQIEWIQCYLMKAEMNNWIEMTEEMKQPCFHIAVFQSYLDQKNPSQDLLLAYQ